MPEPTSQTVHASCVSFEGKAVLIKGASGSGKSSLALQIMAFGAQLVSDDRTELCRIDNSIWAAPPKTIAGLIEARGLGILNAEHAPSAQIVCVVDMDMVATERLPDLKVTPCLGLPLPCLHKIDTQAFPAIVLQYLKGGIQRDI
jgi:HPr kinase/phosphorylase